ncbi:MAG: lipopolysaccharide biosynthesis protein [Bacteroidales bacterium]|nr:lipopolysaccharide biosynthesis protein [Bacteroidales bacterium]
MENNSIQQQNNFEEEIDLIALAVRLWKKRWFIVKVTCVFAVIGFIVAITTPVEYTAKCVVMPDTRGGAFSNSNLGGLAAMAGINLGASSGGEMLSPSMYNSLLKNVHFCKELVQTPLNFKEYEEPVTILDYYTKKEYQKFSLGKTIRKYTIGLPGVIMGLFRGKQEEPVEEPNVGEPYNLDAFTAREQGASGAISQNIAITTDGKNGSIEIKADMPDPVAAAQVVVAVQTLLQKYVIKLKLLKAEINYNFIKERYDEAKKIFDEKQEEYARYQDANKTLSTALSKTKGEQIRSEYEVASSLFNQLTSQLVQAEMKVKEDIPILTVVEPVIVPLHKSKPNIPKILIAFTFLGGILGCGLVFGADWLLSLGLQNKWLNIITG